MAGTSSIVERLALFKKSSTNENGWFLSFAGGSREPLQDHAQFG